MSNSCCLLRTDSPTALLVSSTDWFTNFIISFTYVSIKVTFLFLLFFFSSFPLLHLQRHALIKKITQYCAHDLLHYPFSWSHNRLIFSQNIYSQVRFSHKKQVYKVIFVLLHARTNIIKKKKAIHKTDPVVFIELMYFDNLDRSFYHSVWLRVICSNFVNLKQSACFLKTLAFKLLFLIRVNRSRTFISFNLPVKHNFRCCLSFHLYNWKY